MLGLTNLALLRLSTHLGFWAGDLHHWFFRLTLVLTEHGWAKPSFSYFGCHAIYPCIAQQTCFNKPRSCQISGNSLSLSRTHMQNIWLVQPQTKDPGTCVVGSLALLTRSNVVLSRSLGVPLALTLTLFYTLRSVRCKEELWIIEECRNRPRLKGEGSFTIPTRPPFFR